MKEEEEDEWEEVEESREATAGRQQSQEQEGGGGGKIKRSSRVRKCELRKHRLVKQLVQRHRLLQIVSIGSIPS
jgi:hypothetical protein